MANFCSNCGSPLTDGKPCTCMEAAGTVDNLNQAAATAETQPVQEPAPAQAAQQPAPSQAPQQPPYVYVPQPKQTPPIFTDLSDFFMSFFKSPVAAVRDFAEKGKWQAGLVILGVNVLLAAIVFAIFFWRSYWSFVPSGWKDIFGDWFDSWVGLNFGKKLLLTVAIFFGSIVGFGIMYGAVGGVVFLGGNVVLKKNCSFTKVLAALAASTVPVTLTLLVSLIFGFISVRFAYNLIAAGTVAFFLLLMPGARQAIEAEEDAGFMILAVSGLVFYILYTIFTRLVNVRIV